MKQQAILLTSVSLIFGAVLWIMGLAASPAVARDALTREESDEANFAKAVAGAYFGEFDASILGALPSGGPFFLPAITTLHEDGTGFALDATDGGLGGLPGFSINTPSQGNWVRTGERSLRVVSLFFSFIRPEDAGGTSGVLQTIVKLTFSVHFDPGLRSGSGLACQQALPISNGMYDPARHNPLVQLPPIDCTADFPAAIPFTFERIQ